MCSLFILTQRITFALCISSCANHCFHFCSTLQTVKNLSPPAIYSFLNKKTGQILPSRKSMLVTLRAEETPQSDYIHDPFLTWSINARIHAHIFCLTLSASIHEYCIIYFSPFSSLCHYLPCLPLFFNEHVTEDISETWISPHTT